MRHASRFLSPVSRWATEAEVASQILTSRLMLATLEPESHPASLADLDESAAYAWVKANERSIVDHDDDEHRAVCVPYSSEPCLMPATLVAAARLARAAIAASEAMFGRRTAATFPPGTQVVVVSNDGGGPRDATPLVGTVGRVWTIEDGAMVRVAFWRYQSDDVDEGLRTWQRVPADYDEPHGYCLRPDQIAPAYADSVRIELPGSPFGKRGA